MGCAMRRSGTATGPWLLSAVLLVPGALPGLGSDDPPPDGGEVTAEQRPAGQGPAPESSAPEKEQKTGGQPVAKAADGVAPTVACAAPDRRWHASNIWLRCTATDAGGLAHPQDASFILTTTVHSGVETATAETGTRQVCDVGGNCTTAGPVTGIRIDRKAPEIDFRVPAEGGKYGLFTNQNVGYQCLDLGAGVLECRGDQPEGSRLKTGASTLGARTFTVVAVDKAGNKRRIERTYSVEPVVVPATGSPAVDPPADKPPAAEPPKG
jgi:hypothetical protein